MRRSPFRLDSFLIPRGSKEWKGEKRYFDSLAYELGIKKQEDWYSLTAVQIYHQFSCNGVKTKYGGSMMKALNNVYPMFEWHFWKFCQVPRKYWSVREHKTKYFDWLAYELQIETQEDWYQYTGATLDTQGYSPAILKPEASSLCFTLKEAYPMFDWFPWKFINNRKRFHDKSIHRPFLDWIAEELGITQQEQWYKFRSDDVEAFEGGQTLLESYYNESLHQALTVIYPEYTWMEWKFGRVTPHYWDDVAHQLQFMEWFMEENQIESCADWYTVKHSAIIERGGGGLLKKYNDSLHSALNGIFPEYEWAQVFNLSDGQKHVWSLLKTMLGDNNILINYKHPELHYENTQRPMELDLYVPNLKLAFEYQGDEQCMLETDLRTGGQHYNTDSTSFGFGQADQRQRDFNKKAACKEIGITLIEVPYWWDCNVPTLISTIRRYRPDIKLQIPSGSKAARISKKFRRIGSPEQVGDLIEYTISSDNSTHGETHFVQ